MIIWSSINCPTIICSPTVWYFSRVKPLVKTTAPGSLLYYVFLCDLFYLPLFSDLLNQKYKNTLLHFILFAIYLSNLLQLYPVLLPISGAVTRKGLTTPLTCWVASICYLCVGVVYVVLLGSPTGLITLVSSLRKNLPLLCCIIPSSLGKYRPSSSRHQKEFLAPLPGGQHQHLPGS